MSEMIYVDTFQALCQSGVKVVKGGKHGIAVIVDRSESADRENVDRLFAIDNRCPHMGFPLHKGSWCDGILTCHWHHARFDLQSGGTLDPWADDATTYPVNVVDGEVWVDPHPYQRRTVQQLYDRLREGMQQNIRLIIAKAVVGLMEAGESPTDIVGIGIEFGTRHRRSGWQSGLTILTAMANILPKLDHTGKILALYQGLVHVSRDSAGMGTRFLLGSLSGKDSSSQPTTEQLQKWYRHCLEVRDEQGAERVLLTTIEQGASTEQLSDMMLTAVTDHVYMNAGHTLDFHNKAFEALAHIGDTHRPYVLTSLLPGVGNATRSEELHSWQSPVNLVEPLQKAFAKLPELVSGQHDSVNEGQHERHNDRKNDGNMDESALVDQILSDRPVETIAHLTEALAKGVAPIRLAQLVTLAAAERIARFHTQNEFGDWITVLHTFTHAHAVHESLRRSTTAELTRGVFHAAMTVYLDRFLNIPSAKRPSVSNNETPMDPQQLLELLDRQQQVDEAAAWVLQYVENGEDMNRLFATLGHALLREDAEFHSFQMVEAAFMEYEYWLTEGSPLATRAKETLILAVTRYLAGHAPTARELPHTAQIAMRLQRGEHLFDEE